MIIGEISLGSKKINLKSKKNFSDQRKFSKILSKTGIKVVYEASKYEDSLTLAIKVGKKILKKIEKKIDSLFFISQSHVSNIPSSSSLLQKELNINKECFSMDIVQGCSGFTYALITAVNLINGGSINNSLIVCSETYRKYINKNNLTCSTVFSDGASAFYLDKINLPKILSSYTYTDGSGAKNLCLKKNKKNLELYMHGSNVFTFTNQNIPKAIEILLKKAKLKLDDIEYFIFHQASSIVLETLREKMKIPKKKFYNNFSNIGNTVSNTIPIALIDADKKKLLPVNKPILIIGFGVGYSVCGGIFIFDKK